MMSNYGLTSLSNVVFFKQDTGEVVELGDVQEIRYEATEDSYTLPNGSLGNFEISIDFDDAVFGVSFYTKIWGMNKYKDIARLEKIYNRTNKKRIQKKLEKRIVKMCQQRMNWE